MTEKFYQMLLKDTMPTCARFNDGDGSDISPFVSINQPIVNGNNFFEYIHSYAEIYKRLFLELDSYQMRDFKQFYRKYCLAYPGNWRVGDSYIRQRLHHLMLEEFDRTSTDYVDLTAYDADRQGTSVPHYLFNFTDYLYWWMKDRGCAPDWNDTDPTLRQAINDELALIQSTGFSFLYRNSVEHHYPQKRQEERRDENVDDFHLNCLGNLVLISKSANSRLSDKNPLDKANLYARRQDLPPTRQIIYAITIRNNGWGLQQIDAHLHCMEAIIAHRKELLG